MEEIRKPFVFDEHILKMDYSSQINDILGKLNKFYVSPIKKRRLRKRLDKLNTLQRDSDKLYFKLKDFFGRVLNQEYCRVDYIAEKGDNREFHKVEISGKGIERFFVEKELELVRKKEGENIIKLTKIPVIIGNQEDTLTIYKQPQIILPVFSSIHIKYKFNSSFDLGYSIGGKPYDYLFTNNPFEYSQADRYSFDFSDIKSYFEDFKSKLFYGEPGKVFLRPYTDALTKGLMNAIFERKTEKKGFNLQVQIYLEKDSQLYYQGNMDNEGSFPFFITKDDDFDRDNKRASKPKYPDKVGVKG